MEMKRYSAWAFFIGGNQQPSFSESLHEKGRATVRERNRYSLGVFNIGETRGSPIAQRTWH
jgi:hypothetical protein